MARQLWSKRELCQEVLPPQRATVLRYARLKRPAEATEGGEDLLVDSGAAGKQHEFPATLCLLPLIEPSAGSEHKTNLDSAVGSGKEGPGW